MTVTVNSGVFRKETKLEVVMVLDNTGRWPAASWRR